MFQLYPDQEEIMGNLRQQMRTCKSVLLQSPTGSGKTAMATDMLVNAAKKGKKTLFSVPRRELMHQTSNTFASNDIRHGFVASGKDYNPFANTYIGMVDTMARRLNKLPDVDLVVFDETHFGADALGKVINHYKKKGKWIIGLSATPWKMNGQGLGIWYDRMVMGKPVRWLMDNGRLSNYRYFYGRPREDFESLRRQTDKVITEHMESSSLIIGDCVADYRKRCMGRLHIVRCTSIKHSQTTAQAFRNEGIPAAHVDGNTPDAEKTAIFKAFARREILVLTFADLLNFGFDLSQASGMDVCIESGSDLKPSKSLAGQMQFWGRMLRKKPDAAIINDHVNNHIEHGLPCSDREWTLDSQKKRIGEKVPPTKQCPECWCTHPPAPKCPECGNVYKVKSPEGLKNVDGELLEIDIQAERNKLKKQPEEAPSLNDEQTLDHLIKYARKIKKKNPTQWAAKELAKRMNKVYV